MSVSGSGTLYVVATPIGNLGDLTARAAEVLASVDRIAAEDTRHTRILLQHIGVSKRLFSLHQHNERARSRQIIDSLLRGEDIALVSDAGTPLISDPGYLLVRDCLATGLPVLTVPGPSAVTAALAVSGLPTDRFAFEGFLPPRSSARRRMLQDLAKESRTLVFFESPRRLKATLADMVRALGGVRRVSVLRELTKRFEETVLATLEEMAERFENDDHPVRGELVIIVEGCPDPVTQRLISPDDVLPILAEHLQPGVASQVAIKLFGGRRNDYYDRILALAKPDASDS